MFLWRMMMIEIPKTQIICSFKQIKTAPLDFINVLQEQIIWEVSDSDIIKESKDETPKDA